MNLCAEGHEEVCFEGRNCPACEIIKDKDKEIAKLEQQVSNLESDIENLQTGE